MNTNNGVAVDGLCVWTISRPRLQLQFTYRRCIPGRNVDLPDCVRHFGLGAGCWFVAWTSGPRANIWLFFFLLV